MTMNVTRKEAIKTLRELWRETNDSWYEEVFNIAIEALSEPSGGLISRADAIELCADAQGRASTKAELKGISKVWQGLLKLPSVEGDWTPVSEGLPDTDVPVLVSDGVYVWEDELQEDYEDGKTVYWWDSQCSFDFNDTAWMPRPKPYKKDDEA